MRCAQTLQYSWIRGGGGAKVCHITKNLTKGGDALHTLRLGWKFIRATGHQMSDVMCANDWALTITRNHCLFLEAFGTILFPEITIR